jgi:NAD(P)-dependent dehydrogenase (short-subunit alcohol dehydrogenase family)
MNTTDLNGRWVAVTGAGSGIGEAIARACAARGANLAVCDINPDRLDSVAGALRALGAEVVTGQVDVSDGPAVDAFAAAVHERTPAVDIVVNNAGVTMAAGALDTTPKDWDWVLGVNLYGVIHGCAAFAPAMRDRRRGGHVVNIASMDGLAGMEGFAAYTTAKFGVVGYSESLRAELAHYGIGVTTICPGPIRTSLVHDMPARGRFDGTYRDRIRIESLKGVSPDRVARAMFRSIDRNRALCPVTPLAWMTYYMKRLTPTMTATMLDRVERDFLTSGRKR